MSGEMGTECRHVARSDDPFKARMRFHQSWYREHILGLPPGPNPAARGAVYGSQLTEKDGDAGRNYLTPEIYAAVTRRIEEGHGLVEPRRARRNLLSSQPMCFNLWSPLADDLELASRLVRSLLGLPEALRVTNVIIEHAPNRRIHLGDATAFDAFVAYELASGRRGFVGIETKLTEPFSRKRYEFDERYRRWMTHDDWWWRGGAELDFADVRFNQLWRNHLLAFAMLHQDQAAYDEGFCAVVYHDGDASCHEAVDVYRTLLRPEAAHTLLSWPLNDIVDAWEAEVATPTQQKWLADFKLRYLDLEASQRAWDAFREETGT